MTKRGKPTLKDDPDAQPRPGVTDLARSFHTCWRCRTEYRTSDQATSCEMWHEDGEPGD